MRNKEKPRIIRQTRNKLKEKALRDATSPEYQNEEDENFGFSQSAIEKMNVAFQEAAEKYPNVAKEYLKQLEKAIKQYEQIQNSNGNIDEAIRRIHWVAHELKGQGATFGYPLLTVYSESLCKLTKPDRKITNSQAEIIKAHYDLIRVIILQDIKGNDQSISDYFTDLLKKFYS